MRYLILLLMISCTDPRVMNFFSKGSCIQYINNGDSELEKSKPTFYKIVEVGYGYTLKSKKIKDFDRIWHTSKMINFNKVNKNFCKGI